MRGKIVLLFSSFALVQYAAALVYSSTLDFKTTRTRLQASELENTPVWNDSVVEQESAKPAELAVLKRKEERLHANLDKPFKTTVKIPVAPLDIAQVFVVDEEALLNGQMKPIAGAQVSLIHPRFSRKNFITNSAGTFNIPYPLAESLRVFVQAPGFAPGIGYATMGSTLVIPLFSEKRLSVLAKSLALTLPSGRVALLAHSFNEHGDGIENAEVKVSGTQNEIIYSGPFFGGIPGYFIRNFKRTDNTGTFLINGLTRSPKHIDIIGQNDRYAFDIDLTGIPEEIHFLSTSFRLEKSPAISTNVVDSDSFERPNCGIRAIARNYAQAFIPDEDGEMFVELPFKNGLVEMKVQTKCSEYLPTTITQNLNPTLFPPTTGLFTMKQVQDLLSPLNRTWSTEETLVLGHIYPEKVGIRPPSINSVQIKIFDSEGKMPETAKILYFNKDNELDENQNSTDPHHENFMVLGLEDGEWHFVYTNTHSKEGLGMQIVRTHKGQITQVDF